MGQYDKSAEAIASAMKAINGHKDSPLCQNELARILGLIAYSQMHKRLAVSAEGFYRSAIEKFEKHSNSTEKDNRLDCAIMHRKLNLIHVSCI